MEVDALKGKVLTLIEEKIDELIFHTSDGERYKMHHEQDCSLRRCNARRNYR
ncbi:DUF7448 domain-containing protein [Bacillus carboniphilus]|uniref:DUF7448 domain-containing protein n=1 Tax=Bacillus carboniphilus TaxID=86663 RepID=UPI003FCE74D8